MGIEVQESVPSTYPLDQSNFFSSVVVVFVVVLLMSMINSHTNWLQIKIKKKSIEKIAFKLDCVSVMSNWDFEEFVIYARSFKLWSKN